VVNLHRHLPVKTVGGAADHDGEGLHLLGVGAEDGELRGGGDGALASAIRRRQGLRAERRLVRGQQPERPKARSAAASVALGRQEHVQVAQEAKTASGRGKVARSPVVRSHTHTWPGCSGSTRRAVRTIMPPADATRQCESNRSVLRDIKDATWMGRHWLGDLAARLTSGEARTSSTRASR
jgi:hypothetical protein